MSQWKRTALGLGAALGCGAISGLVGSATVNAFDLTAGRSELPLFVVRVAVSAIIVAPFGALAGLIGGLVCALILRRGVSTAAPGWEVLGASLGIALGLFLAALFFAMGWCHTEGGPARLTSAGVTAGATCGLFIAWLGRRTRSVWQRAGRRTTR